jgi:hypothetical protein
MTEQKNNFAKAFIKAQLEMVNASKEKANSHFKSKYADLTSVREACVPFLNKYGIAVLQPIIQLGDKQYIKTLLLHESGEEYSCLTEIIHAQNTAQAHGSGITYARRYGLQSLVCIGADDDDGNEVSKGEKPKTEKQIETINSDQGIEIENLCKQKDIDIATICKAYNINSLIDLPNSKFSQVIKGLNKKPDFKNGVVNANN